MTTTLHIEHPIHDFAMWKAAFDGLADDRDRAGVLAARIAQPVDDERYVVVDLDFADAQRAPPSRLPPRERLEHAGALPALAGEITTRILEPAQP